jgi:hypothetical protein
MVLVASWAAAVRMNYGWEAAQTADDAPASADDDVSAIALHLTRR